MHKNVVECVGHSVLFGVIGNCGVCEGATEVRACLQRCIC